MDPVKLVILAILAAIVVSMGSALFHLVHDRKGETKKMVRALTVRISLSVALFILLFIAYALGLIEPHGVRP
jgi:formate/nitrite transporter FocA (FNT family)